MNNKESITTARISRRTLLRRTACGAAAACCSPAIVPSSVLGALAPSNRINVGFIGLGNQSRVDLPAFLKQTDAQVVAVCDVNTGSYGYDGNKFFLGRKPGQERVNAYYAKQKDVGQYKGCDAYNDFREVIGRSDVDAVVLIVPDHWHATMTIMAAKAGKDIYCEKPLSLTIQHGQQMVNAVREHKRVLQTGSMWRSAPMAVKTCELVRNGRIGQVKRIFTDVAPNNRKSPGPGWKPMPVPDDFDYELWLGPAPSAPYHKDRCFYTFRFIVDYSGGQTTNFGAHSNGLAQWALDADHSGPVEFEDLGAEWPAPGDLFTTSTKVHYRARYAGGAELICQTSDSDFMVRFEGSDGWVEYGKHGLRTSPDSLARTTLGPQEVRLSHATYHPSPNTKPDQPDWAQMNFDHARNFLDCIKSRQDPIEPVEAGHRTASLCHLANIAMKLKRKIRWDPQREQILGDEEAGKMLSRPMRAPWTL